MNTIIPIVIATSIFCNLHLYGSQNEEEPCGLVQEISRLRNVPSIAEIRLDPNLSGGLLVRYNANVRITAPEHEQEIGRDVLSTLLRLGVTATHRPRLAESLGVRLLGNGPIVDYEIPNITGLNARIDAFNRENTERGLSPITLRIVEDSASRNRFPEELARIWVRNQFPISTSATDIIGIDGTGANLHLDDIGKMLGYLGLPTELCEIHQRRIQRLLAILDNPNCDSRLKELIQMQVAREMGSLRAAVISLTYVLAGQAVISESNVEFIIGNVRRYRMVPELEQFYREARMRSLGNEFQPIGLEELGDLIVNPNFTREIPIAEQRRILRTSPLAQYINFGD